MRDAGDASPQLILAFDFGRRRIGVACGDTLSRSAGPLSVVANGEQGPRWDVVDKLVREWQPSMAVVGLPYHVDGSESVLGREARAFAGELARRYGVPVHLIDERYSSLEAHSSLAADRRAGRRARRVSKADIDAAAACIILERWFEEG